MSESDPVPVKKTIAEVFDMLPKADMFGNVAYTDNRVTSLIGIVYHTVRLCDGGNFVVEFELLDNTTACRTLHKNSLVLWWSGPGFIIQPYLTADHAKRNRCPGRIVR